MAETWAFIKMDGTGNDFIIFDRRAMSAPQLSADTVKALADRNHPTTKGCDQLIVLSDTDDADVHMRIYNADGGEVDACGNATRCVGWLLGGDVLIETAVGLLQAKRDGKASISVDMGEPKFDWQDIPLVEERDTLHTDISAGALSDAVCVSMGNPHAVFFVEDADNTDVTTHGPKLENDSLFPERANIGVAQIIDRDTIRLRVWERGTGETQACGTGACAAAIAANRRDLANRDVTIHVNGGTLHISWEENNHVILSGEVYEHFRGEVEI